MIVGVGTDMVSIARVEKACAKESFLRAVYTSEELSYAESRGKGRVQTLAGLFAAKEAVAKALGTGIRGFSLQEIEILHTSLGQPYVRYGAGPASLIAEKNITATHLSVSHEGEMAIAYAVAEKAETGGR